MSALVDFKLPAPPQWQTIVAGATLFTAGFLARGFVTSTTKAGIIPSPRTTLLPKLPREQQLKLPYPPDALPGSRDIETPFGTFRAYEWGPETGRKVLLVHGISTPCLALGGVAHKLVEKGCRVMLFDLPGRGYSDNPTDLQHDMRLFTSQILLVLASSSLSWSAGDGGFALVGYSLGGGISASFASYFPKLINSLTLITPSGLIRDYHITLRSRIIYSEGVIPEPLLNRLVRQRLRKPSTPVKTDSHSEDEHIGAAQVVTAEIESSRSQTTVLSKAHPDITIEAAVNHQIDHHQGFIPAFMSSIRYGPVRHNHNRWSVIAKRLNEKNRNSSKPEKVLLILGDKDTTILYEEIKEDALNVLENNVDLHVLSAGHEVPISHADEVGDIIWRHLQSS